MIITVPHIYYLPNEELPLCPHLQILKIDFTMKKLQILINKIVSAWISDTAKYSASLGNI